MIDPYVLDVKREAVDLSVRLDKARNANGLLLGFPATPMMINGRGVRVRFFIRVRLRLTAACYVCGEEILAHGWESHSRHDAVAGSGAKERRPAGGRAAVDDQALDAAAKRTQTA